MFLYFDEAIIKWCQWTVRQVELFLKISNQSVLSLLIAPYLLGTLVHGLIFAAYISLLHIPLFLIGHMLVSFSFLGNLAFLRSVIITWRAQHTSTRLRTERRKRREVLVLIFSTFVGMAFTLIMFSPYHLPVLYVWFEDVIVLLALTLLVEYALCTEGVSADEWKRRRMKRT